MASPRLRGTSLLVGVLLLSGCATDPSASVDPSDAPSEAPTTVASSTPPPGPTSTPAPTPTPTPTPSPSPSVTPPVVGAFNGQAAFDFAVELASQGTRDAGTPGDLAAQDLIEAGLAGAGWNVVREVVPLPQGGQTANLVATLGDVDRTAPHVVVGGHFDTRGGSPGANDNASGIGVLVAVAAELADEVEDGEIPLVLVAFGAEEYQPSEPRAHHLGSEQYAEAHAEAVVAAMIVDMVGNGPDTCICWFDAGPRTLADRLVAVAASEGIAPVRREARGDISDHGPFARRGVPAAFLWTGGDGRLHTPADTAEHLQLDDIQRAGDLTLAFVRSLAAADVDGLRSDPAA